MNFCAYCGEEAKYQFKNGKWCCSDNRSKCKKIRNDIKQYVTESWKTRDKTDVCAKKEKVFKIKTEFCEYGCGKKSLFLTTGGMWCCSSHAGKCDANRKRNSEKIKQAHKDGKVPGWKAIIEKNPFDRGWRRGLTKENDERVKKAGEEQKRKYQEGLIKPSFLGRKHSAETRKKLSEYPHKGGRGKKGWYKGYYCDSTWELAWVIYNLEHKIKFERNRKKSFKYFYNGQERTYYPDFILEDGTFIEIKGWLDDINKQKIKCLENEKYLLIGKNEIKSFQEYVIKKYGKNFYTLYEQKEVSFCDL